MSDLERVDNLNNHVYEIEFGLERKKRQLIKKIEECNQRKYLINNEIKSLESILENKKKIIFIKIYTSIILGTLLLFAFFGGSVPIAIGLFPFIFGVYIIDYEKIINKKIDEKRSILEKNEQEQKILLNKVANYKYSICKCIEVHNDLNNLKKDMLTATESEEVIQNNTFINEKEYVRTRV